MAVCAVIPALGRLRSGRRAAQEVPVYPGLESETDSKWSKQTNNKLYKSVVLCIQDSKNLAMKFEPFS